MSHLSVILFKGYFLTLQIRSDDSNTAINLLTRVAGIGPAKARSLVDSGISTIEQLRDPSNKVKLDNSVVSHILCYSFIVNKRY